MSDFGTCDGCGERPALDTCGICQWCDWLCVSCGEQPVEAALRWIENGNMDLCFLCQEEDERETA